MTSQPDSEAGAPGDAELVDACKKGGVDAYEQLYRLHGSRMKSIAYHFLGNTSDAEDAVQDVFLKIYRGIGSFRGGAAFSTWCYRILLNTCYDMMRRHQRVPADQGKTEPASHLQVQVPSAAGDHPLRLTLEKCLQELPLRHRAVFLLFEVEGFKHREIAALLDIPEGTSKTLLFEAKRELQKALWQSAHGRRT